VPGSPTQSRLQEILSAARRATELTRQLLAYSRNQPQALRVAELNPVVGAIVKTLRRLIGEDINLIFVRERDWASSSGSDADRADTDESRGQRPGCYAQEAVHDRNVECGP